MMQRQPLLRYSILRLQHCLSKSVRDRKYNNTTRIRGRFTGQFKSPGRGVRGPQFGRQSFHGSQQGYPYPSANYPGTPGMERRMSSAGSEGDSFLQAPGDEGYDYQQLASDDSHDTQQSTNDLGQAQAGFHGAFGNGSGQQAFENRPEQQQGGDSGGTGLPHSPPDIKYEVTPMPFMKTNDFELIEIDPDDEDDI